MTKDGYPIHVSPKALERVAALRLSGLPLAVFLVLLANLDSTGRAGITQPELPSGPEDPAGRPARPDGTVAA